ncbi:MAG: hypothetical protein PV340_05225 [Wolbachia sp.]|nr:hypothetical protein [Wolbachia sp.]MDD9336134.1 hypothetical protein [Wolbachia sp.]
MVEIKIDRYSVKSNNLIVSDTNAKDLNLATDQDQPFNMTEFTELDVEPRSYQFQIRNLPTNSSTRTDI